MTVETHLARLAELSRLAQEAGQMSAAITAETKRGEVLGYYVQRSQNTNHNYVLSDQPMAPDTWAAEYAQSPHEQPAGSGESRGATSSSKTIAEMQARLAAIRERDTTHGKPDKA